MKHTLHFRFAVAAILLSGLNLSSIAQNTWVQKAYYSGGVRTNACGFAIDTTGYILTGSNGSTYQTDMWAWDQRTNTWSPKNNFPGGARIGAAGVSLNGKGYVIGGKNSGGSFMADVWEYFASTDSWSQKSSFPGSARYYAIAVSDPVTSKIYYGTGDDGGATYLYDWWSYDPTLDSWTQLANFPGGQRSYGYGFFVKGNVYAGVGNNNDGTDDASNDWWEYKADSNSWTQVASVPGNATRDNCTFVIGVKGYLCLGINGLTGTTSDIWMYDPALNIWSSRASYGGGTGCCAVGFSIGNKGYVGTGQFPSSPSNTYWEFTPAAEDTINGINNINVKATMNLFPNPCNGKTAFTYSGMSNAKSELKITDIIGKLISTYKLEGTQGTIKIDETTQSNGIYVYLVINNNKVISTGKLLILK